MGQLLTMARDATGELLQLVSTPQIELPQGSLALGRREPRQIHVVASPAPQTHLGLRLIGDCKHGVGDSVGVGRAHQPANSARVGTLVPLPREEFSRAQQRPSALSRCSQIFRRSSSPFTVSKRWATSRYLQSAVEPSEDRARRGVWFSTMAAKTSVSFGVDDIRHRIGTRRRGIGRRGSRERGWTLRELWNWFHTFLTKAPWPKRRSVVQAFLAGGLPTEPVRRTLPAELPSRPRLA